MTIKFKLFQTRASRSLTTALLVAALLFITICRLEDGSHLAINKPLPSTQSPPPPQPPQQQPLPPQLKTDTDQPAPEKPKPPRLSECPTSPMHHLVKREYNLTDTITYTKRCIKPVISSSIERDTVANISESLFNKKTEVDLTSCAPIHLDNCDPLPLRVHNAYPKASYSHIIFGAATSFDRFRESVGSFAFWLGASKAKFVGVVSDYQKHPDLEPLDKLFRDAGIDAVFVKPANLELSVSQNHFTVIRDLVAHASPETQWFGLLDDDTFFPSLHRLSDALSQFDHTQHQYVGALSEDFRAVRGFGYMAFGGAGIFLSSALARHMEPLVETCLAEAKHMEGDALIRDCTYHHSKAKLTPLPGLQQMDLSKDASGFYEGGPNPISLHHWKSWYQAPVVAMSSVARVCGDCFLQRWRLGGDTVLANGYSISVYRDGTDRLDLSTMEATWNPGGDAYDYSIGPLRGKLPPQEKKQYRLREAVFLENGDLRQTYIFKSSPESPANDEVIELIWEPSQAGVLGNIL